MTTTKHPARNGVNTASLLATLDAVRANPSIARFQFRPSNTWVSRTHRHISRRQP